MIYGKNIDLRMIKQSDLDQIIELNSDARERGEYLGLYLMNDVAYRKRYQETGLWNDEAGTLAITDKNGRLLGDIGFFAGVRYLPGCEIGYGILRREDRGKGYTTEALQLFTAYLFDIKQNIHRIEVHADVDNIGSRRVAEKAGYTFEGIKRDAVFVRGGFRDLALYSILRGECPKLKDIMQL